MLKLGVADVRRGGVDPLFSFSSVYQGEAWLSCCGGRYIYIYILGKANALHFIPWLCGASYYEVRVEEIAALHGSYRQTSLVMVGRVLSCRPIVRVSRAAGRPHGCDVYLSIPSESVSGCRRVCLRGYVCR